MNQTEYAGVFVPLITEYATALAHSLTTTKTDTIHLNDHYQTCKSFHRLKLLYCHIPSTVTNFNGSFSMRVEADNIVT